MSRLLLLICASFFSFQIASADKEKQPKIQVDSDRIDFGQVEECAELRHIFKISNLGTANLTLHGAYSSCGCTVPKLASKELSPGQTTEMLVVVDTTMKQGKITKTVAIASNDPLNPTLKVYLAMKVKNPHTTLTDAGRAKIFSSDHCNSCHVARGNGLFGKELFDADCAMCHGKLGLGAIGPQLLGPYENNSFRLGMEKITSFGSTTHRSMPGFLVDAGGPLSKEQIASIMQYLETVSQQRYYPGKSSRQLPH